MREVFCHIYSLLYHSLNYGVHSPHVGHLCYFEPGFPYKVLHRTLRPCDTVIECQQLHARGSYKPRGVFTKKHLH